MAVRPRPDSGITTSLFECRREGLTIRGTEYRPAGDELPIAIVSHGFMAFQDTVRHYAIKLAELGYCAYCFDFCGGSVVKGKSDGKTTEMSVLTEVRDLKAVIEYAKGRSYTRSEDMLLMGCSQGGFVSALTAKALQEQVSKLVLFYPALCIPDDAREGKMMFAKFDPQNIPDVIRCGPMKLGRCYPADVIDMDPFEEIKDYMGKVLIVHGTKDGIVRLDYAQNAFEAYSDTAPDRTEFHIIEGGGHGFSKKHDKEAIAILEGFARL